MGLNPNQPRQAGGKFGSSGTQKPTTYKKAAQIPAAAISPQMMAQARQILAQRAAAVKSAGKLTPAQRQYLRTLTVARGLIMKNQSTALAAARKQAAAQKKAAGIRKAAAGRHASIIRQGQQAESRKLQKAQSGPRVTVRTRSAAATSAAVSAQLAQRLKRP